MAGHVFFSMPSKGQHPRPSPPRKPESDGIQCLLNEDQGYYEIGPQHEDNKIFILSVTIGLASNLAKVDLLNNLCKSLTF